MNLPIDVITPVIPNSGPPKFRWRQTVNTVIGKTTVDHEGLLPASVEAAVASLIGIAKQLVKERDELKRLNEGLAERVAGQSEPLSNKAEVQPIKKQSVPSEFNRKAGK